MHESLYLGLEKGHAKAPPLFQQPFRRDFLFELRNRCLRASPSQHVSLSLSDKSDFFDAVRPSPGWLVTDLYQDPDLTKDLRLRSRSWPRPGPSLGFNLDLDLCLGLALALGLYLPSSHFLLSAFPMKLDLFPQRYEFSYGGISLFYQYRLAGTSMCTVLRITLCSLQSPVGHSREIPLLWKEKSGSLVLVLRERDQQLQCYYNF